MTNNVESDLTNMHQHKIFFIQPDEKRAMLSLNNLTYIRSKFPWFVLNYKYSNVNYRLRLCKIYDAADALSTFPSRLETSIWLVQHANVTPNVLLLFFFFTLHMYGILTLNFILSARNNAVSKRKINNHYFSSRVKNTYSVRV